MLLPPSGPHEPWPVHAPTDGGERAAGGAHAALVTGAMHKGDTASGFNYLDLVTAKNWETHNIYILI